MEDKTWKKGEKKVEKNRNHFKISLPFIVIYRAPPLVVFKIFCMTQLMPDTSHVSRPRNPNYLTYCQCVKYHLERSEKIYDECIESQYGFSHPYLKQVIHQYLDCGDLQMGFSPIKCRDCGYESRLTFSCKCREFCSCSIERPL